MKSLSVPTETAVTNAPLKHKIQRRIPLMSKFGLIGYPLGHSISAVIHAAGFKSLGIEATYDILETDPEDLVDRVKYLKHNHYNGFNVTIPLKLPISLFLQEVDKSADIVGATLSILDISIELSAPGLSDVSNGLTCTV